MKTEIIREIEGEKFFDLKTSNQWIEEAKSKPIPKMLFGEFWFQNEICILFADSNVGKSILAVQIAEQICKGENTCNLSFEVKPQKVIYFDFELSSKQFENRYSNNYTNHYTFSDFFFRAEINSDFIFQKDMLFEDLVYQNLEDYIIAHKSKIIIIDNLTYLVSRLEKGTDSSALMMKLNKLKRKYNLSILILAHTPKRNSTLAITQNDLGGSKMLMNFCDSSFTIGKSMLGDNIRYIKQIKQRNVGEIYGTNNVIICKIENLYNFLKFEFEDYGNEVEHLKIITNEEIQMRNSNILELQKDGISNVAIAKQLNCSEGTVRNILKKNNL
jgi:RecA-family ATPase